MIRVDACIEMSYSNSGPINAECPCRVYPDNLMVPQIDRNTWVVRGFLRYGRKTEDKILKYLHHIRMPPEFFNFVGGCSYRKRIRNP